MDFPQGESQDEKTAVFSSDVVRLALPRFAICCISWMPCMTGVDQYWSTAAVSVFGRRDVFCCLPFC